MNGLPAAAVGGVRGKTGCDSLERISPQMLMEIVEVPQRQRTARSYRHLATLMAKLGWTALDCQTCATTSKRAGARSQNNSCAQR
jgi:hypothetical protein